MGIALEIIDIVRASIPPDIADPKVKKIHLSVGKLSAVIPDSLRFCFDTAGRDTLVEGAELVINRIPVTAMCRDCGHEFTIENPSFSCQKCNKGNIKLISGRELDIDSIEISDD